MNVPENLRYTKSHEWAQKDEKNIVIGITDHAQHEITDVVHVELPQKGKKVEQGKPCVVVESVKSAFDIYAPVSGTVVAVNSDVESSPELVNQSPYDKGHFIAIEPSDPADYDKLLSPEEYKNLIK
jgi:glycine cleavage system H protein